MLGRNDLMNKKKIYIYDTYNNKNQNTKPWLKEENEFELLNKEIISDFGIVNLCKKLFPSAGESELDKLEDGAVLVNFDFDNNSSGDFIRSCRELSKRTPNQTISIRHPSILIDILPLNLRGRICLFGFPGAGNLTTVSIINKLLENTEENLGEKEHNIIGYAVNAHMEMESCLSGFREILPYLSHPNSGMNRSSFRFLKKGRVMTDDNLKDILEVEVPDRNMTPSRFFSCHQMPSEDHIDYAQKNQLVTFVQIRNPLDNIVSAANKFVFGNPECLLGNYEWFKDMAKALSMYMERYHKHKNKIKFIRYEDLISSPRETIEMIMDLLPICDDTIEPDELWSEIGFQPLREAHYWRPGEGKYREYLDKRHYKILDDLGVLELSSSLGYDISEESFKDTCPKSKIPEDLKRKVEIFDYFFSVYHAKEITFNSNRFYGQSSCSWSPRIFYTGDDLVDEFYNRVDCEGMSVIVDTLKPIH